ncbi:MAG: DNA translocase FtsK 4TM domain-containing protein, partial [Chlamydiota bacterium]|nr:DNA translocase FtsK 4TM domain-containing protein [Chlamydiota bacterium]
MKKKREIRGFFFFFFSLLFFLSLFTFEQSSPDENWLGLIGHCAAFIILSLFGLPGYVLVGWLGLIGWKMIMHRALPTMRRQVPALLLFTRALSLLFHLLADQLPSPHPTLIRYVISRVVNQEKILLYLGGLPLSWFYQEAPWIPLKKLLAPTGTAIVACL